MKIFIQELDFLLATLNVEFRAFFMMGKDAKVEAIGGMEPFRYKKPKWKHLLLI